MDTIASLEANYPTKPYPWKHLLTNNIVTNRDGRRLLIFLIVCSAGSDDAVASFVDSSRISLRRRVLIVCRRRFVATGRLGALLGLPSLRASRRWHCRGLLI